MTRETTHPDLPGRRLPRFRDALRCPSCRHELQDEPPGLRCVDCGVLYSVVDGRPILMTKECLAELNLRLESEDGQRMVKEYADSVEVSSPKPLPAWVRALRPPPIMYRYHDDLRQAPTAILFAEDGQERALVLNVGGGPHRVTEHEVTLNIGPFPGVDLVADAHNIPLADETVDAVFSLAVLEHVGDPQQVVREMMRVLKPGGVLYSEVPFIFFFHGYPSDYTRFTREGMRRLFSGLEGADIGMTHGPVSAVLQSANMVMLLLLPERFRLLHKLINGVFRWLLFPLKYLDLLLRRHPDAHILAGGFYVLGRKPARS